MPKFKANTIEVEAIRYNPDGENWREVGDFLTKALGHDFEWKTISPPIATWRSGENGRWGGKQYHNANAGDWIVTLGSLVFEMPHDAFVAVFTETT